MVLKLACRELFNSYIILSPTITKKVSLYFVWTCILVHVLPLINWNFLINIFRTLNLQNDEGFSCEVARGSCFPCDSRGWDSIIQCHCCKHGGKCAMYLWALHGRKSVPNFQAKAITLYQTVKSWKRISPYHYPNQFNQF